MLVVRAVIKRGSSIVDDARSLAFTYFMGESNNGLPYGPLFK